MLCNAEGHMSMLNRSCSKECMKRAALSNAENQLRQQKTNTASDGDHFFPQTSLIHFHCAYQLWKRAVLYIAEYQLRKHQKPIPQGTAIIFFYKLKFVEKDFDCAYQLGKRAVLCNAEYPNTRVGLQCSQQTADSRLD
jgi:hypothetical protein